MHGIRPLLFYFFLLFLPVALSWWNYSWKYRIPITIQENSGNTLTDYQVQLVIDTASLISQGKLRSDCGDLRFTYLYSNGTEVEIPYWIESGCNTANTIIWIKVPEIPASGTATVYMYYGNPSATSESNKSQVFVHWVGDINKYCYITTTGAQCSVTFTTADLGYPGYIFVDVYMDLFLRGDLDYGGATAQDGVCTDSYEWVVIYRNGICVGTYSTGYQDCTWRRPANWPKWFYHVDQEAIDLGMTANFGPEVSFNPGGCFGYGDADFHILEAYLRKYVSPEPSYTLGPEELVCIPILTLEQPVNNSALGSDNLNIKVSISHLGYCSKNWEANITFLSPISKTYSLTCDSSSCYGTIDLNELLYNVGIASDSLPIEFKVIVKDVNTGATNETYGIVYVRTNHNVYIRQPTLGSIVLGSGFIIKAQTDSVFKIKACYPNLPPGAKAEKIIIDNETKTCEIWVDLSNYCSTNIISFNVTIENTVGVNSTSYTQSHYIYDPQIILNIVEPSNTNLSLRYLKLKVAVNKYPIAGKLVPTTRKFNVTIGGVNYTLYGTEDGYLILELYHKGSNPEYDIYGRRIPSLYDLLGHSDGNITLEIYGLGRCGYANGTKIIVHVPKTIFEVNFTSPTPSDGSILQYLFMEVQGKINENILADPKCELWISKDNGFSWIRLKDLDNCYGYIVNDEFDLNNLYYDAVNGYYVLKYKIKIVDLRWNETNETGVRTIYIPYNAEPIPVVNPRMSSYDIQAILNKALEKRKPAILFESGAYRVNLIIDAGNQSFRLIGANSVLEPKIRGLPVITVKSGKILIDRIQIKNSIFNVRVFNGEVNITNSKIMGGLYGIEIINGVINLKNNVITGKISGIKAKYLEGIVENNKIYGKVWGLYIKSAHNVVIKNNNIVSRVYGIKIDSGINVLLYNNTIRSGVFGVQIFGRNVSIDHNIISGKVYGIRSSVSNITNDIIIARIFGIYVNGPVNIENTTVYSNIFGFYGYGNISNLRIYNAKLGVKLIEKGYIDNLYLGRSNLNINYTGNLLVMYRNPIRSPSGMLFTGGSVMILGRGNYNITFLNAIPQCKLYYIYKVLGLPKLIAEGKSFSGSGSGIYALYCI